MCSWIRWINVVKISILAEAMHCFNATPIKLPMLSFTEWKPGSLKIYDELQKTEKLIQSWERRTVFQTILPKYSNQSIMVLAEKETDQWKRIESPERNPGLYGQFLMAKEARIYHEEKTVPLINNFGKTGQLHVKKNETVFLYCMQK